MQNIHWVGIDLGKHSFHVHGQDRHGHRLFREKLNRKQLIEFMAKLPICKVAMEACAGAHAMARHLATFGHEVKLIAPQFVRPFVKGNKNDFIDAEAICEAASRPSMRFVTPKTEAQQTLSALHRVRESLVRDRVRTSNQIHAFLLEFGISLPIGKAVIQRLPVVLAEHPLPPRLVSTLERLQAHYQYLQTQIDDVERDLSLQAQDDALVQRLMAIPGIGPITASCLAVVISDGKQYGCGRDFAASIGLVPRQYSTGGRQNLLGISKRGDKNLRRLLVQCARSWLQHLDKRRGRIAAWVTQLLQRRHSNVVACALANKLARMAWAMAANQTAYREEEIMIAV